MRRWFWGLRWGLSGRLMLWAILMMPPGPARNDLIRVTNEWIRAWAQRLREERGRQTREAVRETTEAWRAS